MRALLLLAVMALAADAHAAAAKKDKKTAAKEEPPPPPPKEEPAPPPPPAEPAAPTVQTKTDTNKPADFGSGYYSWGTRGGATLGQGGGANAILTFGAGSALGYGIPDGHGWVGLEGHWFFNLGEDFDFGLGLRLPIWPIGIAPGAKARIRVMNSGKFQLAIDASAYLPMYFVGYFAPGSAGSSFLLGLSIEPGVTMSYFIKDNMELYFGVIVPVNFTFVPGFGFGMLFNFRGGFAYTLKRSNVGLFADINLAPGLATGIAAVNGLFVFTLNAGVQFRF